MNLIIPVAGKSSRFPGMRPKWLLTHPTGSLMVVEAIRGLELDVFDKIFLIVLEEHVEKYEIIKGVRDCFSKVLGDEIERKLEIISLKEETKNQPETVFRAIAHAKIEGPIFIKDSDNFFTCSASVGNFVVTYDISEMSSVNAGNKSYVVTDDNGVITSIVEKRIISAEFCAGGYSFDSASRFKDCFLKLRDHDSLYISHMIYSLILDDVDFGTVKATEYLDWGTLWDWNRYRSSFGTFFIDLDGVLVENSGRYLGKKWGTSEPLIDNIRTINELYDSGNCQIIITTSRSSSFRKQTEDQLENLGINYHQIVFDLMHCKRVIINDYSPTNPYRSCDSVNLKRNSDNLREKINEVILEKRE